MPTNIPPMPDEGKPVTVSLDVLPEFLEAHKLQIVKMDHQYLYVKPREEQKEQKV
jgi:hypothetical protein